MTSGYDCNVPFGTALCQVVPLEQDVPEISTPWLCLNGVPISVILYPNHSLQRDVQESANFTNYISSFSGLAAIKLFLKNVKF
jgi:hypothetical protein